MFGLNPIIDDKLTPEARKEIDNISTHPLLEVPVRTKGITSGKAGCCYWNASIASQTWGGEVVFGWMVYEMAGKDDLGRKGLALFGHAVWKTPEGKLVDVTNHLSESTKVIDYLGFLPFLDKKPLFINGQKR